MFLENRSYVGGQVAWHSARPAVGFLATYKPAFYTGPHAEERGNGLSAYRSVIINAGERFGKRVISP